MDQFSGEQTTLLFVVLYDGPASRKVHFVAAIPVLFYGGFTIPCRQAAVHLAAA